MGLGADNLRPELCASKGYMLQFLRINFLLKPQSFHTVTQRGCIVWAAEGG